MIKNKQLDRKFCFKAHFLGLEPLNVLPVDNFSWKIGDSITIFSVGHDGSQDHFADGL